MYADILRKTGTYSDAEADLFGREVTARAVKKHALILSKGDVAHSICYLLEGSVFQYDRVSETDQRVVDLHVAGDWFLNQESLITRRPSTVFMEAFSDCRFLEIRLETVHYLTGKSSAFLQLNRVFESTLARTAFFDQSMTPVEKYRFVLSKRPQLLQAFPLKIISSYLKVTPETLSRVRKAISRRVRS